MNLKTTVEGSPEGAAIQYNISAVNTTGVYTLRTAQFSSGVGAASTNIGLTAGARYAIIQANGGSSVCYYIANTTGATTATALKVASTGFVVLPVVSTAYATGVNPTSFVFFSSGAPFSTNTTSELRITFL